VRAIPFSLVFFPLSASLIGAPFDPQRRIRIRSFISARLINAEYEHVRKKDGLVGRGST
jgi:hypothetical protein